MNVQHAVLAGLLVSRALVAQGACQSFAQPVSGAAIDLAPLSGYVEICGKDAALCQRLTSGYPPSVVTLAYFLASDEWDAHVRDPSTNFGHYLIAQLAGGMKPADLPGFKSYVHAQNGTIPDHTQLPSLLQVNGQASLGILDESDSSISFGTVMLLRRGAEPAPIQIVATNSMLATRGRVLSLYVYRTMRDTSDVSAAVRQTKQWLACIKAKNG